MAANIDIVKSGKFLCHILVFPHGWRGWIVVMLLASSHHLIEEAQSSLINIKGRGKKKEETLQASFHSISSRLNTKQKKTITKFNFFDWFCYIHYLYFHIGKMLWKSRGDPLGLSLRAIPQKYSVWIIEGETNHMTHVE